MQHKNRTHRNRHRCTDTVRLGSQTRPVHQRGVSQVSCMVAADLVHSSIYQHQYPEFIVVSVVIVQ